MIECKLIENLVPADKHDLERAQAAIAAGYPRVGPILDDLLMWIQDVNWPVARVLLPFLASLGSPLVPHVQRVLSSEDHVWKYNVIAFVIAECETLRREFEPELCRLVASPTEVEKIEELAIVAADALGRLEEHNAKNKMVDKARNSSNFRSYRVAKCILLPFHA